MRNIGILALGMTLAALSVAALPSAGHAYTPEEQAACQPDAFRLCGSEIPNIDRVTACMLAKRAQLSPECKRYFRADPQPVTVTDPPAGAPVNIRPRAAKPRPVASKPVAARPVASKPVGAKPVVAKPASTKKPTHPKAKKPAKPPTTT
jgi:hypothetical protein